MPEDTFTHDEALKLCKPVIEIAIRKRELEVADALAKALELAGDDLQRLQIAVEMIARTLSNPQKETDQ